MSVQTILQIIKGIILASQKSKAEKIKDLEETSANLSLARIQVRLMKDTAILDLKKYITLQECIDTIGRMLGGWIRSLR